MRFERNDHSMTVWSDDVLVARVSNMGGQYFVSMSDEQVFNAAELRDLTREINNFLNRVILVTRQKILDN